MAIPTTHEEQGWQLLQEGLASARSDRLEEAVASLFGAATSFERGEDYRLIPGIWEAVGELLEKIQQADTSVGQEPVKAAAALPDGWGLEYRVISEAQWQECGHEPMKRLALVYQWAAQHRERANDPDTAQKLYFKAASYWEQTREVQQTRPHHAGRMYYRAVLNHIRWFGTATEAEPKAGRTLLGPFKRRIKGSSGWTTGDVDLALRRMHSLFCRLAVDLDQPGKAYKLLATAYSSLKSALLEAGNVVEAREMEKRELWASRKLHWVVGHPLKWAYYRMRTGGFVAFLGVWIVAVVLVFPLLYLRLGLQPLGEAAAADLGDAVLYSAESALILGHRFYETASIGGHMLSIAETALSYFGLGASLWFFTKKIE